MENLSHSRKPNRGSSHATLSTKRTTSCNGTANLSSRTMYDDAFGGAPRFFNGGGGPTLSPRPEDYTEIFGGFHASRGSSIPVLDLPLMNDSNEVMFDVRNPRFNYADVFGGFDGLDFPASYEGLMRQAKAGDDHDHDHDHDGDSSDEAWMQAETESLSEGSDHSGKYRYFSNGDYCEPIDTGMEFNISYHKANVRGDVNISSGITHVAQLHADPEYAYVIENPLQKMDKKNPPLDLADGIDLEFTNGVIKKKHLRKTVSHPSNRTTGEQTFTNDSTRREYRRTGSCSDEMFVTISNVNLRTAPSHVPPPSRPPPFVNLKNGDYQNRQHAAPGGKMGDNSPPFFDVEIDASSAAAASAAAMKEAMDKAQAKLKSAKEQLERKREGVKSSTKPASKSDGKSKKERANKTVEGSGDIEVERVLGMNGKEDSGSGMKMHVREERQRAVKSQVADSLEGEKHFNAPKRFVVEKLGNKSQSIHGFVEIDETDEWQEATQFFELVRTDKSRTVLEQMNNEKVLVQSMKSHELQHKAKKANIGALEQQLDSDEKVEAVREDHELDKVERDMKTAKESCERGEPTRISRPVKEARKHKGHEKKVKTAQEVSELEENGQSLTAGKPLENGKKPTGTDELGKRQQQINAQQKGNMVEAGQDAELKENGKQEKQTSNSFDDPKRVREFQKQKDEEKSWREVFEQEKHETNLEVQVENEKRQTEVLELEEKEEIEGTREREESAKKEEEHELEEKIWRMALEQLENEKRLKQAHLQEENERRQRKALEQEEMVGKQREAHEVDASKRRPKQVTEEEKDERQQKEGFERKEAENRLRKAGEEEAIDNGIKEAYEKEATVERFKEDHGIPEKEVQDTEEVVKKRVVDLKETEELLGVNDVYQHTQRYEKGKKPKFAEGTRHRVEGENSVVSDAVNNDQNIDETEESGESTIEENGKVEVEFSDSEKKSDPLVKGDVGGRLNASGMAGLEAKVSQFRNDDISDLSCQDDGVKKTGKAGNDIGQRNAEKINSVPKLDSDNENQGLKFGYEWKERFKNVKEAQVYSQIEEDDDNFVSAQAAKEYIETGRKHDTADVLEGEESIQRTAQSTERKDKKVNESLIPEEEEAERLKRERELEKERLRKIEEREREREREKDRMAVDIAALEAYERGYVEARERAERAAVERATAEARQRAMSEVRDRLEKACAEAREKSSMETRLRAERAAVERATAEARERAVEKAMAERAAFEARERVERSMSDKFSTSRNVGMRTSSSYSDLKDQHIQSSGSFDGLRYPYSSTYNGVEGESAQRCKARLERYRRTAERAAKALEEKNMRDLLAQREQAERNRFAETLDADVKRWSSGKEGNLRALLSTLQYILGPESGWQSIPLTEVITSAAVKKAYRKATLCVHPDKLQQRGASIQHKYVCEKVFDLLKEAWNKFNSEER
ncbi:Chaperone DnaJ-domain superfamily protein, putative isoform 2 [Hibiscus syriacus]|uniref:Chaperone DnaJ-domain superfamily protein, putative isoform 2 n=1 Tax=Hibiscus syriacus TaxID=106335 RepID=A0A6A3AKL8_HIBSY|nr:auxilin-like protein 1 [Hibiscus syriacus]KAE8703815.1 Chaperone DnaJ-domain superfamily protein, putative isoform 2 [Hibiscus syriacus]